jgi:hypothetical protein
VRKPTGLGGNLLHKLSLPAAEATDAYSTFRDGPVDVNNFIEFAGGGIQGLPPTTVAKLALPAGKWVIVAKANGIDSQEIGGLEDIVGTLGCALVAGADYDVSRSGWASTLASTVVHRFPKPGAVELRCQGFYTAASWIKITAVRVASLKNTPFP